MTCGLGLWAQEPPAPNHEPLEQSPEIPLEAWDDDWWYPEGTIKVGGRRYSLFAGAAVRLFTQADGARGATAVEPEIDLYRPGHKGLQLDLDVAWTGFTRSGNVTRFVAPTLGVRRAFVDSARAARYVPFGAVRVGPYFTRSTAYGSSTVLGANATVGVEAARVATLSARYDAVPGRKASPLDP